MARRGKAAGSLAACGFLALLAVCGCLATVLLGCSSGGVSSAGSVPESDWGQGSAALIEEDDASDSDSTRITIDLGGVAIEGELFDTPEAEQFRSAMPVFVSMVRYGEREYYGGFDGEIETSEEGDLTFEDGVITYCPTNNTIAIFFSQSDRPNLTMGVIPIGRVTSDLAVFDSLDNSIDVSFYLD